jgi:hypothetical protein
MYFDECKHHQNNKINQKLKIISLSFFNIFLFINGLLGQKPGKSFLLDTGIYKVSAILANETITSGYYYFKNNNQYEYFGNAQYNYVGKYGIYCAFSKGFWKISKENIITMNDSIKDNYDPFELTVSDSVDYNAAYRMPYDSISFDIQVFDENGAPLKNEIIELKTFANRLLETDETGKLKFKAAFKKTKSEKLINFMGNEPYYKTSIAISSQYNYHQLKIYLKKIPERGFLPSHFIPKNGMAKIELVNKDTIKIGKYQYLTKASASEIKSYISEFEKVNPYFQPDFKKIKSIFGIEE